MICLKVYMLLRISAGLFRERHELEVFRFNQEIDSGKMRVKSKDNEIDALRSQLTKSERERDNLLVEKSEVIRGLQERLDATQKRLAQSIAEVGSQGYNNVKAMHQVWSQKRFFYALLAVKTLFSKILVESKQNSPIHDEYPANAKLGQQRFWH